MTYIVIVNYNGHEDTITCLESLYKMRNQDFKVLIVDNSATDVSAKYIEAYLQLHASNYIFKKEVVLTLDNLKGTAQTLLIKAGYNKGFAAANNIALRLILQLNDGYVWLLNNDTLVTPSALDNFIHFVKQPEHSTTGLIGCKIYEFGSDQQIQAIAGEYLPLTAGTVHIGYGTLDRGQFDRFDINAGNFYPIGASIFCRLSFVKSVGLLEEEYFLYFEEIDWVIRGKRNGWKVGFCSEVVVRHKGGVTINGDATSSSLLADKCNITNRIKITRKYYPLYLPTVVLGIVVALINRIKRGQHDRIIPILKAVISGKPV